LNRGEAIGIAYLADSRMRRLKAAVKRLNRDSRLCRGLYSFQLCTTGGTVAITLLQPHQFVLSAKRARRAFERDLDLGKCAFPIGQDFARRIDVAHRGKETKC